MGNFTKKTIYKYNSAMRTSDLRFIISIILVFALWLYLFFYKEDVKANKEEFDSIQQILNLDWCRVTQGEESHLEKWHGSMYAFDISCWEAVKIFAPKDKEFYRVKTVSFDSRIGDYVILKNGDLEYVFWHTKSGLKKGDRVESGKEIWVTSISWKSTWCHLHFELWKYGYNISYKHLLWEAEKYNMEKSYVLRKQRGWYLGEKEAMDFIADFEWFRAKPYIDWDGRLSIWYGTKAKWPNDYVTKEEAKQRKIDIVQWLMESVYKNHFVKYHNQRIAIVSATYNLGINSSITKVKNRKTEKWVKEWFGKFVKWSVCWKDWCITKKLWGLVKRRSIEANLYLNK